MAEWKDSNLDERPKRSNRNPIWGPERAYADTPEHKKMETEFLDERFQNLKGRLEDFGVLENIVFEYQRVLIEENPREGLPINQQIFNLVTKNLKEAKVKVKKIKQDIIRFKIYEAFFESLPQFLLQQSILFRMNILYATQTIKFGDIQTVASSLLNVTNTMSSMYLKMPYMKKWKKPQGQTEIEEQCEDK